MIQRSFFKNKSEFSRNRISHGGAVKGRKVFRPLDRRKPLHVVLKSSHARGRMSFITHKLKVADLVDAKAAKYGVKIHGFENMGNHLHMVVSFKSRKAIQDFLRVVTGLIARMITGAQKGRAFGKRFWDHLVFTRVVTGKRDYRELEHYLLKNEIEREYGHDERAEIERYARERQRQRDR